MYHIVALEKDAFAHSNIPSAELDLILHTDTFPESIVTLLNEAETRYAPTKPHWNAKRVYPFWKVCEVCSKPFPCYNKEQAVRNKTCSKECASLAIGFKNKGFIRKIPHYQICPICGKQFVPPHGNREAIYCSKSCCGKAKTWLKNYSGNMKGKRRKDKRYGSANPAWKGGVTYFKTHGNYVGVKYVRSPEAYLPMARKDGYVMEHRLIVAQHLGRCLKRSEVVHHIDHNPSNNNPSNLMLFASNAQHKSYEGKGSPPPIWQLDQAPQV